MKETIVKINKTKMIIWEDKIDKLLGRFIKKNKTQIKKIRNEKEELQQTIQKYKRIEETIMNNSMAIK